MAQKAIGTFRCSLAEDGRSMAVRYVAVWFSDDMPEAIPMWRSVLRRRLGR